MTPSPRTETTVAHAGASHRASVRRSETRMATSWTRSPASSALKQTIAPASRVREQPRNAQPSSAEIRHAIVPSRTSTAARSVVRLRVWSATTAVDPSCESHRPRSPRTPPRTAPSEAKYVPASGNVRRHLPGRYGRGRVWIEDPRIATGGRPVEHRRQADTHQGEEPGSGDGATDNPLGTSRRRPRETARSTPRRTHPTDRHLGTLARFRTGAQVDQGRRRGPVTTVSLHACHLVMIRSVRGLGSTSD